MDDTYQHNRMEPYAEAIGRPSQSAGPRRRTPKQLERKRAMDKAAQKLKREKDKSWKSQVQSNLRSMQEEIHSLREDVNRMLGGISDSSKSVNTGRLTNYSRLETIPPIINVTGENTVAGGCSSNSPTSWSYTQSENPPVLQETATTNLAILSNPSAPYRYDTHVAAESPFKHSHSDSPEMDAASTFRHQPLSNQPSDNEKSPGYSTRSIVGQSSAMFVGGLIQRNYVFPGAPSPFGTISQSSDPLQSVLIEDDHEPPVGCRCDPIKHGSYADCVEQSVFDALIRMHKWNVNENLPVISRSPALVDMLFLRKGENAMTQLISKMLHRSGFRTLAFLFSAYILVYRVLRYRFFPSLDTFHDIPEWLRPSSIQDTTPHLVFTDFVHFPKLRAAMVLGSVSYIREEFDYDYSRHVSLNWPGNKSLLVRSDTGEMILNPDFEPHVFKFENWSMDSTFARKYPQMAPLVTIRH